MAKKAFRHLKARDLGPGMSCRCDGCLLVLEKRHAAKAKEPTPVKEWEFVVTELCTRVYRVNGKTVEEAATALMKDTEANGREVDDTFERGEVLGIKRWMGEAEYDPLEEEYTDGRTI